MTEHKELHIDIESFSSADINRTGVYRYAESPDFEILLFGYSFDGEPVKVIDLACGEELPEEVRQALTDDTVTKIAHNANFERVCLSRYLGMPTGQYLDAASWHCTMVWSATLGLPLSLKGVGTVLGLEKQKLEEGRDLIRYFCMPCTPTAANGRRHRNLPKHAPDKWETFKAYNLRDVETEMEIAEKLSRFPVPDEVWDQYHMDQEINDRGILVDMALVKSAISMDSRSHNELSIRMQNLTALENPNSVSQMKKWLADHDLETESLGKKDIAALLKSAPEEIRPILQIRQQLAKTSVKKYLAMQNAVCFDSRARGMFQFGGASRTLRWAGRIVQLQNLPQNHMPDLEEARALVRQGNYDALKMLYGSVPDVLSELIRTAFIAQEGKQFYVADFSAIEARVIAWLAGEEWRIDLFRNGGDIYCQSASKMFKVPVEKHGVNGHLRQKGKVAELACIAESSLVLTNHGEKAIEDVTQSDLLWDGENWVQHDGVVYRGEREVITYEGLTATPDHLVWCEGKSEPVQFGIAAASRSHLIQIGNGGEAVRLRDRHQPGKGMTQREETVPDQSTARVYDIRNAGPNHRFTVSGRLVHNCGYGGSVGALKAMGALEMGLTEEELPALVSSWREANPNIVKLWWDVDRAAMTAVKNKTATETHGLRFCYESGFLFITLPSGRRLAYVKPRIGENQFGSPAITYEGVGGTKKWERLESYGPKFVENIVQATSRDILCHAMSTLRDFDIVAHVHDELIIEADPKVSLETICQQMGHTPPWCPGLVLRADGYVTPFYKKD